MPTFVLATTRQETGKAKKTPRLVSNPDAVMSITLQAMTDFVKKSSVGDSNNRDSVSAFIASDTPNTRRWFKENAPIDWHIISTEDSNVTIELPPNGVWFGEHGSRTAANLTQESKNDKMAEAVADMFALGECSALFIPTYSSFTVVPITLTNRRNKAVMYRKGVDFVEENRR
jgi:hypothetical protein